MTRLWDQKKRLHPQVAAFTVGEDTLLDQALVSYDCRASMAHARMLGKIGILSDEETERLVQALEEILELDRKGKFTLKPAEEDCHTAIENYLTRQLGDLGRKIHTARSRNDQVLTALRLYCKAQLGELDQQVQEFIAALEGLIEEQGRVEFPGFTHTRKAMPSSVGLWAGAYRESMEDNQSLLEAVQRLVDQSPLGTAAGYGVPLKIDREYSAELLGFGRIQRNPLYAQLSRGKFETSILHVLSQVMLDLNRLSSDLILFTLPELGYFRLPAEFCTGSSIMPHKQNPDVLEVARGNYHLVAGYEIQLKTLTANLIGGYHRDLQLTKAPLMKSFGITAQSLGALTLVVQNLEVDREDCRQGLTEELFSTEKVYRLVEQGVPFREAYRRVAEEYK